MIYNVIPLRYDTIFKRVFGKREIFISFVKDVLGIDIEIETVEFEKRFYPTVGFIAPKFDLFAEDKKNRLIIEIQHEHFPDHYERFLYYHSLAIIEQIKNSQDYRAERTVYTIVVQTSPAKLERDYLSIDWKLRDLQGNTMGNIHHKIIYLNTNYINEQTPEGIRAWLSLIGDSLDEKIDEGQHSLPLFDTVLGLVIEDNLTPYDRAQVIEDRYLEITHQKGLEEGLAEGLAVGLEKGLAEGLEMGLEKGIEKGIEAGKLEVALNMIRKGLSIEQSADFAQVDVDILRAKLAQEK